MLMKPRLHVSNGLLKVARKHELFPRLGCWICNENAGVILHDISGNAFHATYSGGTTNRWIAYPSRGYAVDYNGSSDSASIGIGPNLANKSFSIGGWVKRDVLATARTIFSQGTSSTNNGLHFNFLSDNTLALNFWGNDLVSSSTFTDTTEYHFVVGTYNSVNNNRTLYYDGVEVGNGTATADYQGSGNTYIGNRNFSAVQFWDGRISDVYIWDYELSLTEISYLYNNPYLYFDSAIKQIRETYFDLGAVSSVSGSASAASHYYRMITI